MERTNAQIDTQETFVDDIPVSRIRQFVDQPRKEFDEDELLGLANSIEEIGLQQPVPVKRVYNNPDYDYELVDGERRWRAHRIAHLTTIKAFIMPDMSKDQQFARSVAANFCRVGHTPMETASALQIIINGFIKNGANGESLGREESLEKAAKIFGRSTIWASQHLSLLRLCPEVQKLLTKKEISFQIGIALTGFQNEFQLKFARHIISSELDHRRSLAYIRGQRSPEIVSNHGRGRKPSDDYAIILRGVKKASSELDLLLDISMKKIKEACNSRSTQDLDKIITDLKNLSNQAKLFAENLESVKK